MADADARTDERVLVIRRVFDAPRELVFRLWTAPEHLVRWWGPKDFTTLAAEIDVRPGGAWRRRMRSPEGDVCVKSGVYREIVPPERLVLTYADEDADGRPGHETLVTVSFKDVGGKTEVTLHQALFETVAARDSHAFGWTGCLERFAAYLAGVRPDDQRRR
jgi:uncharacterized protein YndB with AHSA1/START domain